MRHPRCLVVSVTVAILASPAAFADEKGDQVIRTMDKAMTLAKDQHYVYDLVTQEPGKAERRQVMDTRIMGTQFRRVEFLEPGDVKGMRVLVISQTQMYVYLPAYKKVRRVASHAKDQGFMGTTFSHDDISTVTYGDLYEGQLKGETATSWKVSATPRAGKKTPYSRLDFEILKKEKQPSKIEYYNEKGVKVKTEVRTDYSCKEAICSPKVLKLTDHVRNDAWTSMTWRTWEVNTGISESFFSLRTLQR